MLDGKLVAWNERLLVVRSNRYTSIMQAGLKTRLIRAENALQALTPAKGRGKHQIDNAVTLQAEIDKIIKQYRVDDLLHTSYLALVNERRIRAYRGKPARVEQTIRFQLTVTRNPEAMDKAHFQAGWRIYCTNAPKESFSLSDAVLAYRDPYLEENVFARLHGKFLSITPLYIQRDDHAIGLFHLLSLAARLLALGDYQTRQALAQENAPFDGIYKGNQNAHPTHPRPNVCSTSLRTSIS